jgi:hypothetical protein
MTMQKESKSSVKSTDKAKWGETPADHLGYSSESERIQKRGLEDWEMVEKMSETSDHKIPYWFFAVFAVLLLVAIGLTFPFWGVRPGFERSWFDWGIVAGTAWVTIMAAVIYYAVDYRHQLKEKKSRKKDSTRDSKPE